MALFFSLVGSTFSFTTSPIAVDIPIIKASTELQQCEINKNNHNGVNSQCRKGSLSFYSTTQCSLFSLATIHFNAFLMTFGQSFIEGHGVMYSSTSLMLLSELEEETLSSGII